MSRKILVDADACPVKSIIVDFARNYKMNVMMFVDVNHEINDGYSEVVVVDQGRDSVDFKLIAKVCPGDIVVTQDYGVAAIALSKKAMVIHQSGLIYTKYNIENLLNERYYSQKTRHMGMRSKRPSKRTKEEDDNFAISLKKIIEEPMN